MEVEWDESFFDAQQEEPSIYWVCYWTGDDVERAAQHDPQRITGAESVEEVIAWLHAEKGERMFELFVETVGSPVTRGDGRIDYRNLIRLAGDFRPGGTIITIPLTVEN